MAQLARLAEHLKLAVTPHVSLPLGINNEMSTESDIDYCLLRRGTGCSVGLHLCQVQTPHPYLRFIM